MTKTTGIIFFMFTSVFFAVAQKPTVKFDRPVYDFGQVNRWNNPPAYFLFTNTGNEDVLFLPTTQSAGGDVFVQAPKGKMKPGYTDTVMVYYFTEQTGEFQKNVELYTSNSNVPVRLTVKGNILSLDERAYISCPGFAPKTERVDELTLLLNSLDSVSGRVLQGITGKPKQGVTNKPTTSASNHDVMEFDESEPDKAQEEKPVIVQPAVATEDKMLPQNLYAPNNIIFLIDISGSMKKPDKLPLLKIAMKNLTHALRGIDYVSVIVYSTTSAVLLPSTPANQKNVITLLIDTLQTHGATNGVRGLKTAYETAEQNFIPGGNNQVIIATDGVFTNVNQTESAMYSLVSDKAEDNIKLSVVGFGDDRDAIKMMKKMADKGNGSFIQIPDQVAADEILINEIKMQSSIGNN